MATHGAERSPHEPGSRAAAGMPGARKGSDVIRATTRPVAVPGFRVAPFFRRECRE
jgi:hypothetical protein